jgi:hypothetical protein
VDAVGISTLPALMAYEVAWNSGPLQTSPPALFTDISTRILRPWNTVRGRQYELDRVEAGTWRPILDNRDGAFDPTNVLSPYYPNVQAYRPCRIRCQQGVNMLTPDQATAGEASGFLGSVTRWSKLGVTNDFGYPVNVITSASAWQGSQVYQAVLPSGATQYSTILMIQALHVQPNAWYSFSAQVQVTSGNSPQCNIGVLFYDNFGNELAADGGASATLTAGAGTWTQLTASEQAPAGAYSAWVKVEISQAASLTAATTFLIDGLQFEQSMTPTTWQMPNTVPANLLPQPIATGTQSINPVVDSPSKWFTVDAGGSNTLSQANWLPAAASGQTTALAWTSPIGTNSNTHLYVGVGAASNGAVQDVTQVVGGTQYTGSVYLSRTSTADATVQVTVGCRWFDATGALISTSAGTAVTVPTGGAWIRGTFTANAPAAAAWCRMRIYITSPSGTTAINTIYSAGWQFEAASAASAWTDPGPMSYIFTGFLEQYPQKWELSGTWGRLDAVAVDALGGLGTDQFYDPFIEEVLALNPTFVYELADPASATMPVDTTGNLPGASVGASVGGVGSLTLGAGISGTNVFTGTQGPVASFANTPSTNTQSAMSFIALPAPQSTPNFEITFNTLSYRTPFTRMIAFCVSSLPAHPMYLWSATMGTNVSPAPAEISFWMDASGHLNITAVCSNSYTQTYASQSYADGNWHLMSFGADLNGNATFSLDGVTTTVTGQFINPINMSRDTVGGRVQDPAPAYTGGANALIALAIQWPQVLNSTQITNLYNSWRSASAGESSGARVTRVLDWVGWPGATAIDAGTTSDMGGATDLAGSPAVSGLASVATTENGNLFVSSAGAITFKARSARYNQNTPIMIFGENTQWGEWPYEDAELPTDPIHTYNDVQVSQYASYSQYSFFTQSQQTAYAQSPASQEQNFDRVLSRTINVQSFSEAMAAATYLLGQYQNTTMRAKNIKLNVSGVPGLFNACLGLELGSRIRQMKRPPYRSPSNPIVFDGFVERISWSYDPKGPIVYCTLECSPATRSQYWTMSALRTTLGAQAAAGQNTAKINALPDAAYNALASSLPAGYQLTFDPGTQFAETMTIAAGGIPATNVGYSTATLTFTSNFVNTHSANAVVCEPLPSGYTNPATWDPNSLLGAGYGTFASAASGGVGSQQIQLGPWTDAAANLLASDLNAGDLLWLSPGTANFEGYNMLHPNVSTAGEGALPLAVGTTGASLGVAGAAGTPTVTASASAYQGANVWQTSVGANQATPSGTLFVNKVSCTPLLPYTASIYTRSATTGANPQMYLYIEFIDKNGNNLGATNSATSTPTGSPTAAWTRLTVTATAPAGTVWVQIGVVITGTAPSIAWSWQGDGLQIEQNSAASAYQTCPQVASVQSTGIFGNGNSTAPGGTYINLAQPLVNNHAVGDYVCDPLPPGSTSPLAMAGTARLAY